MMPPYGNAGRPFGRAEVRMRLSLTLVTCMMLGLFLAPGCEDQHVGRLCFIQRDVAEGANVVVNPQALECPSRMCLYYKDPAVTGVEPLALCTAECSSDGDCGGETSSSDQSMCKTGFKCAWPIEVGDFKCRRMCVCADLMIVPDGGTVHMPSICQ
jgi:hypothetical protein